MCLLRQGFSGISRTRVNVALCVAITADTDQMSWSAVSDLDLACLPRSFSPIALGDITELNILCSRVDSLRMAYGYNFIAKNHKCAETKGFDELGEVCRRMMYEIGSTKKLWVALVSILTFTTLLANSADDKLVIFFLYLPYIKNRLWYFMQIVFIFAWNVKACFLWKIRKIFQIVICWNFFPSVNSLCWRGQLANIISYTCR